MDLREYLKQRYAGRHDFSFIEICYELLISEPKAKKLLRQSGLTKRSVTLTFDEFAAIVCENI